MGSYRARQFSIVFHNVKDDCKPAVEHFFSDAQKRIVALEPYPEQHGHHIHVFVQYANQRYFKSVLANCERFKSRIVAPQPPSETRSWGRVQVDVMRGSFEQAHKYLTEPDKDKPVDPNVRVRQKSRGIYNWTLKQLFQQLAFWTCECRQTEYHPYPVSILEKITDVHDRVFEKYVHSNKIHEFDMDDEAFERYLETYTVQDILDGWSFE